MKKFVLLLFIVTAYISIGVPSVSLAASIKDVGALLPYDIKNGRNTGFLYFFAATEKYVYIEQDKQLIIFDVSNPALIKIAGKYSGAGYNIVDVEVVGNVLYVLTAQGRVQAVDVSNPARPVLIYESKKIAATQLMLNGRYIYALTKTSVIFFDVADPLNPIRFDTQGIDMSSLNRFVFIDKTLYATSPTSTYRENSQTGIKERIGFIELAVYNLNDSLSWEKIGSYVNELPTPLRRQELEFTGLIIAGRYAYLPYWSSSTMNKAIDATLLDISNPAKPSFVRHRAPLNFFDSSGKYPIYDSSTGYPSQNKNIALLAATQKNLGYILRDKKLGQSVNQLLVYDLSNPTGPSEVALFNKLAFPIGFMVKGNRIYVMEKDIGIRILEFNYKKAKAEKVENNIARAKPSKSVIFSRKSALTNSGAFQIDMIKVNLSDPKLKIITDVAEQPYGCHNPHCKVKSLSQFAYANKGIAAINGSLFCPKDRSKPCGGADGWFDWTVYNHRSNTVINNMSRGSLAVFTNKNKYIVYEDSIDFPGMYEFERKFNEKITAVISNEPLLIYKSKISSVQEPPAISGRSTRSVLGLKGSKLYLMTIRNTSIANLKIIMQSFGMEYALALDGGGSSALYYKGQYKVGPGRNIPNAIVVAER